MINQTAQKFIFPFSYGASSQGLTFGQFGRNTPYGQFSLGLQFGQLQVTFPNISSGLGFPSGISNYTPAYPQLLSTSLYGSYAYRPFGSSSYSSSSIWPVIVGFPLYISGGRYGLGGSYGLYPSWGPFGWQYPFTGWSRPVEPKPQPSEPTVLVNIQIDAEIRPGVENVQGLTNIIDELKGRNIRTTVFVSGEFANAPGVPLYIRDIYDDGFEIALHGYTTGEQLATMSYTEQKNRLENAKQAVEGCLSCGTYKPIIGFRPQYFSQDSNTYLILDEMGFQYNSGFKVGQAPYVVGHMDDVWPFPMEGHKFCVLPISKVHEGQIDYLCDISMGTGKKIPASEWGEVLTDALDRAISQDEPLMIIFHNWFTGLDGVPNPGDLDGYWQPFIDFLDEATSRGASFVTAEKLVEDYCR